MHPDITLYKYYSIFYFVNFTTPNLTQIRESTDCPSLALVTTMGYPGSCLFMVDITLSLHMP